MILYRPVAIILWSARGPMSETREQIIETTAELLEMQAYQATGLNQIVRQSGALEGLIFAAIQPE